MKLLTTSDETKWYTMLCETIIRIANDGIPDKCPCCEKKLFLVKQSTATPNTTLHEAFNSTEIRYLEEKFDSEN